METRSSTFNADGCVYHLNLPDDLMRGVATKCPTLRTNKSGANRNIRHMVQNDPHKLTPTKLLRELRSEIERQLSAMGEGTEVKTTLSNAEWVVASP